MILILLAVFGFAAEPSQPTPVVGATPSPHVLGHHGPVAPVTDVAQAVSDRLTGKATVACDEILSLGDPLPVREALIEGTQQAMPPWAPLRAAACLTELAATDDVALSRVQHLAGRADLPGFALAISERLAVLPEERAVSVAHHALANPSAALARRLPASLQACPHAPVRALVE